MRVAMVAAAVPLVLALSACTDAGTATAPEPVSTSSPEALAGSPADASAAPSAGSSPEDAVAVCEGAPCEGVTDASVVDGASTTYFHSPSDNITCSLSHLEATCEIDERSFVPPPKPTDCQLDHGAVVSVGTAGPASFLCHGDTGFVQASPFVPGSPLLGSGDALDYGDEITNGVFVCSSSTQAMACATTTGEHGFTLSRAEYRTY